MLAAHCMGTTAKSGIDQANIYIFTGPQVQIFTNFYPFSTQVEFRLGDTGHLPTAHFSIHFGKTAHIPESMGSCSTHRHMPGHFKQTLLCLAKTSGVTQQALIKTLMAY